jgi:hypothetical protein
MDLWEEHVQIRCGQLFNHYPNIFTGGFTAAINTSSKIIRRLEGVINL